MVNLTRASNELFSRSPDERFSSLQTLWEFCYRSKEQSSDRWRHPGEIGLKADGGRLVFNAGGDGAFSMNDWSFSQLCRMHGVAKDTVNRLSAETASRVFVETKPSEAKPLQILTLEDTVRSVHGTQYTRLWNADLVMMLREFATDFGPPQKGIDGATGLYAGEQDMFCFLIDPAGWTEIEGEMFAPGFFVWNSEVGRRSLGIETFWFQKVCQNHIVWDATEVVSWRRKHTANVKDGLGEIRQRVEQLVKVRDARKDGFVSCIRKAMKAKLGDDADECLEALQKHGITRSVAKKALEIAQKKGAFSVWAFVDALTQVSAQTDYAGDRTEAEQRASALLALV